MLFNPEYHHRQSIRLRQHDYSQVGLYFITVCAQHRACLFGKIIDGQMQLNAAGQMVEQWWLELINKFLGIQLHEHTIMPNHMHGVIEIVGADLRVCPKTTNEGAHIGAPLRLIFWIPRSVAAG